MACYDTDDSEINVITLPNRPANPVGDTIIEMGVIGLQRLEHQATGQDNRQQNEDNIFPTIENAAQENDGLDTLQNTFITIFIGVACFMILALVGMMITLILEITPDSYKGLTDANHVSPTAHIRHFPQNG
ncbi:hypothetical protein GCK72_026079 [Caenorhabditis remanei]|uniref:Uncharacterized protein n=1 Tax=Caenorhabditis remanei TaxID=31234 RepID=A0A6A5G4G2_CAERE|nr:hypothetical protein GCK72_026079 [Caenorhabditis remanei]KAF1749611.1 hypothetical protein GCK72_026079 [Caenorhabditis remanei]